VSNKTTFSFDCTYPFFQKPALAWRVIAGVERIRWWPTDPPPAFDDALPYPVMPGGPL